MHGVCHYPSEMNESDVWIYLQLTGILNLTNAVEAYGLLELIGDHQYKT